RTGRAGEQGFAVSFVTRESRRTMSDIEKLIGKNVPLMELETYELDMTVLEKGKKGAPKKGGYKGNKGSGRPAGAKRSDKRGGEKRDFERRSDSRAEGRSDNRPGRGKRAEGKRSFDGAAKPDGPRSNNMDHAKRRLEMSEKKKYEKSAPNAKGAAKQNGSKKKAGVGGYNYSRFANN
ncbi:MAG: ATP-dependent helicase, partial [Eggerthella lenta]